MISSPGNAEHPLGSTSAPQSDSGNAEHQLGPAFVPQSSPGNAEHQLGSPPSSPHREWYSRGYVPHCDHPGLLQSVTYHLADSLPATLLERLNAELRSLPLERQEVERRTRVEDRLDAVHGSCVLCHPEAAACVVDTWRHFGGERYDLIAWVVMPIHVHVLIRTYEGVSLGKIVQSWKSYTGRRIRPLTEDMCLCRMEGRAGARRSQDCRAGVGRSPEGQADAGRTLESRAGAGRSQGVWTREYWDRFVRNERHFEAVVAYIHENPVKAGLVKTARDWLWSSAREYGDGADLSVGRSP
jgi:putative transposase